MIKEHDVLDLNQQNYQARYSKQEVFLRYPADWIIRFHNMFLKTHIPTGRVLDYGCGSGNNSIFFIENGYETYGLEVVDSVLPLVQANLQSRRLDTSLIRRFSIVPPDCPVLPFENGFFDIIISNQVLYYLASAGHMKKVCKEFSRCIRPGGVVFFTMMGPKHYYVIRHGKRVRGGLYEITIGETHRLSGLHQYVYIVRDQASLKRLFAEFECLSVGYYDQRMFDMASCFHWIFVGRKPYSGTATSF